MKGLKSSQSSAKSKLKKPIKSSQRSIIKKKTSQGRIGRHKNKPSWRTKDTTAIFIILAVALLLYLAVDSYFSGGFVKYVFDGDIDAVITQILAYGNWSYVIFFGLIVLECILAPFPPLLLYIAGGTLFGGFISGSIALVANIIGAGIAFQISHHYGKEKLLPRIPRPLKKRFNRASEKYGPLSIFILRINPITSSDLFSYLAGLTTMRFNRFLIGTGLGLLPIVFLQTYLGEQIQSNPVIAKISMLIGVLYIAVFVIGYIWIKKKIKLKINLRIRRRRNEQLKELKLKSRKR